VKIRGVFREEGYIEVLKKCNFERTSIEKPDNSANFSIFLQIHTEFDQSLEADYTFYRYRGVKTCGGVYDSFYTKTITRETGR
jgi:hypothetical protein